VQPFGKAFCFAFIQPIHLKGVPADENEVRAEQQGGGESEIAAGRLFFLKHLPGKMDAQNQETDRQEIDSDRTEWPGKIELLIPRS
jgi:hypothetical protein